MRKILLLICFFRWLSAFGQKNEAGEVALQEPPEIPVFIYGSFFMSQFTREGQMPVKPSPGWDAGIGMEFPSDGAAGIRCSSEFQKRSYSLNKQTEGINNAGRRFIKTIEGRNESIFLQIPAFYRLPLNKTNKVSIMPGASVGFRIITNQAFQYRYEIPSDSIVITGNEKGGTDALDFAEFNAMLGLVYRPVKRLELSLILNHKLIGFSIAKENFFGRSEQNTMLIFRAGWMLFDFGKPLVF